MSFFKRLFSADYRAAVSAEAAGQLDQAAERYVLAGEHAEATRVHLARAQRADNRAEKIAALRDALHWVGDDEATGQRIRKQLGRALLARIEAEGVATHRDRERVREAAELLVGGGDYRAAGEAFESIGDNQKAAQAYGKGGLVDRVEAVLGKDDDANRRERIRRERYRDYEMNMRIGNRDQALADLRACLDAADKKGEYRRLVDELESRLISGGLVELSRRGRAAVAVFAGATVTVGRDPLCELSLRSGGVSRQHAQITVGPPDAEPRFTLRDAGSRNGTTIGGMPIAGQVPLGGTGSFALGDHCAIDYEVAEGTGEVAGAPPQLVLRVTRGLDQGRALVCGGSGERFDLTGLLDLPLAIEFHRGRPFLQRIASGVQLRLAGEDIAHGAVQLVHGDQLVVDTVEVEVA